MTAPYTLLVSALALIAFAALFAPTFGAAALAIVFASSALAVAVTLAHDIAREREER